MNHYLFLTVKEISTDFKRKILQVLTRDVAIGKVTRPLMIALTMTSASLVKVLKKEASNLVLPNFI